jgi:hypothetical protein
MNGIPAMKNTDALRIFSPEFFGGKYKSLKKQQQTDYFVKMAKRSCFTILGEISWKRLTYRLKFEHGQLGKCLRNSLIRQCHM